MALMTPPLHAKGVYRLKAPWTAPQEVVYECVAIRDFSDYVESGTDLFAAIYEPQGLPRELYEIDLRQSVNIITLQSKHAPTIYVPDSFIESFPDMTGVAYSHVVLSMSLGAVPDTMNLDFLKDQLTNVISDVIGVESTVNLHVAPSTGVVSPEQHSIAEAAREHALDNRETDYANLLRARAQILEFQERIRTLEAIVIRHGLLD